MRTKGAKTEKECWELKIFYSDYVVKEGIYKTLKEVADDLNLSYNQVSEFTNKGRNKTKTKYSFYPTIDLKKIITKEDIGAIDDLIPDPKEDY